MFPPGRRHHRWSAPARRRDRNTPGVFLVAGPLLVARVRDAKADEDRPVRYALIRTLLDWGRTGVGQPLPQDQVAAVVSAADPAATPDEFADAVAYATTAVLGTGRRTSQSPVSIIEADGLAANDYLLDQDQQTPTNEVPLAVWRLAFFAAANSTDQNASLWRFGVAAFDQGQPSIALAAMRSLANDGDPTATLNTAEVLVQLGRDAEALETYELLGVYASDPSVPTAIRRLALTSFAAKARVLVRLGRVADAFAIYEDLLRQLQAESEAELSSLVPLILYEKGRALADLGDREGAITTFEQIIVGYLGADSEPVEIQVAKAMNDKGVSLERMDRWDEAAAAYGEVVTRFGERPGELRESVAKALVNLGHTLEKLDRLAEAVRTYDKVIQEFETDRDYYVLEQVAHARLNTVITLGLMNRSDEAVAASDELARLYGDRREPSIREFVATGMFSKVHSLKALLRPEDAIRVCDTITTRYGEAPELQLRLVVAQAMFSKSVVLGALQRPTDAMSTREEMIERFADATEPEMREQVAKAMYSNVWTLQQIGRRKEAGFARDQLLERFAGEEDLRWYLEAARSL